MPPRAARGGHGAGRRSKRGHAAGHEEGGSERWLVTYADMLTLLLVLFIVLFSISVVNTSKFISLKTSLAGVFGNGTPGVVNGGSGLLDNDASGTGQQLVMPGNPVAAPSVSATSNTGVQVPTVQVPSAQAPTSAASQAYAGGYTEAQLQAELADYRATEASIGTALAHNGMKGDAQFSITTRGLVITVVTTALVFPGNSADLESLGQRILAAIAPSLAKQQRDVEVDGYTNQENVSTYPYPSGWELSSARASAVVRYLAAHGVSQDRLSAVGYSDQHPLYPASSPLAVTRNRRVEIVVLSSLPAAAGAELKNDANQTPTTSAKAGKTP